MIIVYQICDYQKTYNIDKYSKNSMFHDKISELVYIKRYLQLFMLIERDETAEKSLQRGLLRRLQRRLPKNKYARCVTRHVIVQKNFPLCRNSLHFRPDTIYIYNIMQIKVLS